MPIPCQSHTQFGDMTLVIGGKDYTVSNEEWMFPAQSLALAQSGGMMKFKKPGPLGPQLMAQVDEASFSQENRPAEESAAQLETEKIHTGESSMQNVCASTIMTMDIAKQMFLVGDVFMRKYYTIFDRENDRVGLALAVTNEKIKALNQ